MVVASAVSLSRSFYWGIVRGKTEFCMRLWSSKERPVKIGNQPGRSTRSVLYTRRTKVASEYSAMSAEWGQHHTLYAASDSSPLISLECMQAACIRNVTAALEFHLYADGQWCSAQTFHRPSQPHYVSLRSAHWVLIFYLPLRVGDWVRLGGAYCTSSYTYICSMLVFWIYRLPDLIFFRPPRYSEHIQYLLTSWYCLSRYFRSFRWLAPANGSWVMGQIGHRIIVVQ